MMFAIGGAAGLAVCPVAAQQWPRRTVRIVVPFAAGTNADGLARFLAQRLTERLGQPVVVDNRPGGGGVIGTQAVITAEPDGHTLLMHSGAITSEVAARKDLPYDMRKALVPISTITQGPMVLLVHPSVPAGSVADLVAHAKANPGRLNFGSSGLATSTHMSSELFKAMAAIDIVHVPYSRMPSFQALAAGEIQILIDTVPNARNIVSSGRARALAVTTATRTPLWPELPTVSESGVPGYAASVWFGLFAPAGTPPDAQARLGTEVRAALAEPETRDWMGRQGAVPVGDTQDEFRTKIVEDIERWRTLVQTAGLRFE